MDTSVFRPVGAMVITMAVWSTVASAQQPGLKAPVRRGAVAAVQGFNIVLVLGDLEGAPSDGNGNVPMAARKALADMKDFLPYKSYRLLDTVWILSASESTSATSRLRGSDDRDYELTLGAASEPPNASRRPLRITFQLRDPIERDAPATRGGATSSTPSLDHMHSELARQMARGAQPADLEARAAAIREEIARLREHYTERHPQLVERQAELNRILQQVPATRRAQAAADVVRPIIDTGFTMDVGETVVVGTSRVRGEKAIIALLTAVPRAIRK